MSVPEKPSTQVPPTIGSGSQVKEAVVQDPSQIPGNFNKSNKVKNIIIAFLGLIAICAVILSAYLFWQNQKLQTQEMATQPQEEETVTPTTDPTANWETYKNTEYGYSIKYPKGFVIAEGGMSHGNVNIAPNVYIIQSGNVSSDSYRFSVSYRQVGTGFKNLVDSHYEKLTTNRLTEAERVKASSNIGYDIEENKTVEKLEETTFQNYPAYSFIISGSYVDDGSAEYTVPNETRKYIWLDTGSKYFLISFTETNTYNQILSTFKFID